ncbi:MAG: hypothetical protein B7X92_12805 [Novosphingobium sp. 17-62-9]|nr:MAG: hypothetical protein B7X92_12805 [Novosphingobium sp. 17-62-9]
MMGDVKPDVCVVGLGYIGLPTAAIIARAGCKVLGLDVSQHVVDTINRGEIHIEEVDLDGLVHGVVQRGLLRASTQIEPADVFVIAVPTPFAKDGHHTPDISYVLAAATQVAAVLKAGDTVILESTSPVGTTEQMRDLMAGLRPDLKFPGKTKETPDVSIAYCPERVLPGRILEELTNNDRSIGGITPRCARKALAFYKRFVRGTCVTTDARSAEMTKLVENAYRDVNIAFANELSMVADKMGLDVWEVIRLANRHPRVNILQPGPGVGGHCIAVDPWGALPKEFEGTGAVQIDVDTALEDCDVLIVLVDHDVFKVIPLAERSGKVVYDTRGIWPDQPGAESVSAGLRLAS